ncbi:MAG: MCE family protein [Deltaproteobacteria bacterium]|nr:MCE family protein [Deltaproteobacteria bacterium]
MNSKLSLKISVGVFVLLALTVLVTMVFILGDGSYFFKSSYTLKVKFKDITGLRLGSPVFLNGYNVGKVDKIEFSDQVSDKHFIIFLNLLSDYQERIREDSTAKIDTQGLLGDKAVAVTVGSAEKRKLENGEYIEVKETISLSDMFEKSFGLLDQVQKIVGNVDGMIQDVKTKKSLVNALLYDPKGAQAVSDLAGTIASTQKLIHGFEKENLAKKFSASAKNIQSMTQNFSEVSAKIEKGEGSLGGLIADPTVYYDLKTLLGKANRSALIKAVIRHTMSKNEKQTLK